MTFYDRYTRQYLESVFSPYQSIQSLPRSRRISFTVGSEKILFLESGTLEIPATQQSHTSLFTVW